MGAPGHSLLCPTWSQLSEVLSRVALERPLLDAVTTTYYSITVATDRIAVAHRSVHRICQVATMCTTHLSDGSLALIGISITSSVFAWFTVVTNTEAVMQTVETCALTDHAIPSLAISRIYVVHATRPENATFLIFIIVRFA